MSTTNYAPKIPFQIDSRYNDIKNINNGLENVKQKIKMVLLTNPGEKFMDPTFGAGLGRRLLFENSKYFDLSDAKTTLSSIIRAQLQKYITEISVQAIDVTLDGDKLRVKISYLYLDTVSDTLTL